MLTVFIIEDDEDIRDLTIYALENAGFICKGFEDGRGFFRHWMAPRLSQLWCCWTSCCRVMMVLPF